MIGSAEPEPVDEPVDRLGQREAAVQHDARRSTGTSPDALREQRRRAAPRCGRPGSRRPTPSMSRGSTLTIDMPATTTPSTSRVSRSGSPATARRRPTRMIAAHRRGDEEAVLRERPDRRRSAVRRRGREPPDRADRGDRSTAGSRRGRRGWRRRAKRLARAWASSASASSAIWPISLGRARRRRARAARRLRPADAAAEHEQHGRAEVGRDARVVAELGGTADIGVVAADDDDGVALRLDRLVALARSWRARHRGRARTSS